MCEYKYIYTYIYEKKIYEKDKGVTLMNDHFPYYNFENLYNSKSGKKPAIIDFPSIFKPKMSLV